MQLVKRDSSSFYRVSSFFGQTVKIIGINFMFMSFSVLMWLTTLFEPGLFIFYCNFERVASCLFSLFNFIINIFSISSLLSPYSWNKGVSVVFYLFLSNLSSYSFSKSSCYAPLAGDWFFLGVSGLLNSWCNNSGFFFNKSVN